MFKSSIVRDKMRYAPVESNRRFGRTYRLYRGRVSMKKIIRRAFTCCLLRTGFFLYLLHADFLLGLFFNPEEGSDMFLGNVS
jgi:hypothetical protein